MRKLTLIICLLFLQACASTVSIKSARSQFFNGQTDLALETLNEVSPDSKNRLLVQFDRGAIAFAAGRHRESSKALLRASAMMDELDYVSLSEESVTLITNDWARTYSGEYSERLWVHSIQMMNFLLLNEPESAAVEARQAIKLLDSYPKVLKQDWFTRALIGMSFEAVGQLDSAHIEYQKLVDDAGHSDSISHLAWNNAKRLGRSNAMKAIADGRHFDTFDSAIVLFLDHGRIPRKRAGNLWVDDDITVAYPIYPDYPDYVNELANISIALDGEPATPSMITTNMYEVAKAALAARGARITAKSITRAATKKAIQKKAQEEDSLLGAFIGAALLITEYPDLRSWETLPAQLSMVIIPVKNGTHTVSVEISDSTGREQATLHDIDVGRKQRVYKTLTPPPATLE